MARLRKNHDLRTRSKRKALETGKYQWQKTGTKGVMLGYRRGARGNGTWFVKFVISRGKYKQKILKEADDSQDANGETVLDFAQAMSRAKEEADRERDLNVNFTVRAAIESYIAAYRSGLTKRGNGRSYYQIRKSADVHILPALGDIRAVDLTSAIIQGWLNGLAQQPARIRSLKDDQKFREENDPRARQATANRIYNTLRAALNRAWREGKIASDDTWRRVSPHNDVSAASERFLSEDECKRLVNACEPDFRRLVQAALFTGARYGELRRTEVSDFRSDLRKLHLRFTKNGDDRYVPLNDAGVRFFESLVAGRTEGPLFLRSDGTPWKVSMQLRRMKNACRIAKVPEISFHELRDTVASLFLKAGASLELIAELLGHRDMRTTRKHYAHIADSYLAETVREKLPNLGGEPVETNVRPITQVRKRK